MMTRNQRLSFLGIAALIAVVAIVVFALGSGPDETAEDAASPAAEQTATPSAAADEPEASSQETATPEPTPTPRPKPPLLQAGEERTLTFTEGETARFRVRSDEAEEVHVHGYDRYIDVPAGKTVNVAFEAGITGIFEIELHGSGEAIGQLKVEPR
jgi:hypothetical protein